MDELDVSVVEGTPASTISKGYGMTLDVTASMAVLSSDDQQRA